jgi:DNA-binding response OmpR family regulator
VKGYEKFNTDSKTGFSISVMNQTGLEQNNFLDSKLKPNLLIADVNLELLNILGIHFSVDYNIITASNGLNALQIAREKNPSLIIANVSLAGLDGFGLCRKIKSELNLCHIPVIFLTSNNKIDIKIKGYEVGADSIMNKPFDINLLSAQVKRLIENRNLIKEKYQAQNLMIGPEQHNETKDERYLKIAKRILKENLADPDFNVQKLASKMNSSTTQLYRNMKEITGHSPVEFIRMFRLQYAYNLLNNSDLSVSEVCFQSGFNHVSYFIKCFKKMFGSTPANLVNSFANNGDNVTGPLMQNIKDSKYSFYKSVG